MDGATIEHLSTCSSYTNGETDCNIDTTSFDVIFRLAIFCASILGSLTAYTQLQDGCFYSVPTGPNFENSDALGNAAISKADMIKYQDGGWAGLDPGVTNNVTVAPPVACDGIKAIFFRVPAGATTGQAVAFRLNDPLSTGENVVVPFTYISHGFGATGSFQPRIYTSDTPELFNADGIVQAAYVTTMAGAGATWSTNYLNFTAAAGQNGHQWLIFYANISSGILMNLCQDDIQPQTWEGGNYVVEACAGETVTIGPGGSNDLDYDWSNGGSTPFINVSSSGFYYLSVDNTCEEVLGSWEVILHEEPYLLPEQVPEEPLLICAEDSVLMTLEGWNAEALWPDGTMGTEWWASEEGEFSVTITDDCFTVVEPLVVDFDTIPTVDLGPDIAICQDEFYTWDVTYPGSLTTYEWQNGSTEPTYTRDFEGVVSVTLTSPCGTAYDEVFLEVSVEPGDLFPSLHEVCFGRSQYLDVSDIEGTYQWNTGETTGAIDTQYSGTISVTIWDDDYCWVVSDSTRIVPIDCECPIWVPNAFTPDGDDLNEVFQPVFECAPYDFTLSVIDRWGRTVYEMSNPEEGWDGKVDGRVLQEGVYNWHLFYRETYDGIPITRTGTVWMVVGG